MLKKKCILLFVLLIIDVNVFSQENTPPPITINKPIANEKIEQFDETIEFQSQAQITSQYIPVVLIRDPSGQWWPWLNANRIDSQGKRWSLSPVQFGGENDSKQIFQIQVILIPRDDIDRGIKISNEKLLFIEGGSQITNRILVTKIRKIYPTKSNVVKVIRR